MSDASKNTQESSALYLELGQQIKALQEDTAAQSGLESLQTLTTGTESITDVIDLGKSFFNRIRSSAFEVLCGTNNTDWKTLATQGENALIAAVAALLVAHLALVAVVASAIAAVIVKIFFDAATKEFCARLKADLPATA